ncbi:hypothetical protein RHMOL_Rhmol01G0208100 [Rhododendron molle]|uniref:Uncharacterized protein n=1 Tax=Rhododendron molle TaxID=49168 RepID=A0ACC0Q6T4_RHOML|nr:hypothetical protein RHMOL_Rhmol01G0208100 [Rhododendron molle]
MAGTSSDAVEELLWRGCYGRGQEAESMAMAECVLLLTVGVRREVAVRKEDGERVRGVTGLEEQCQEPPEAGAWKALTQGTGNLSPSIRSAVSISPSPVGSPECRQDSEESEHVSKHFGPFFLFILHF